MLRNQRFWTGLMGIALKRVGKGHAITRAVCHRSVITRIWSSVRFEMVTRSAAFLGFLTFIRRGFFVRTTRAAQGCRGHFAPDHCEYSTDNADSNIATMLVTVQTKFSKNINPDSTADQDYDLWSCWSKRDYKCYICNICAAILIDCPNTSEWLKSLMTLVYYSDSLLRSTWMLKRTVWPTPDLHELV